YSLAVDIEGIEINSGVQVAGEDFSLAFEARQLVLPHNVAQYAVYYNPGRHLIFEEAIVDIGVVRRRVRVYILDRNIPGVVYAGLAAPFLDNEIEVELKALGRVGAVNSRVPDGAES